MNRSIIALTILLSSFSVVGADLQWSGIYRAEGIFIKNPGLNSAQGLENSYLLHHLVLSPKIIAMDGLNIYSRFDLFNNALNNNQAGQVFGSYTGNTVNGTTGQGTPPAVLTRTQQFESVAVTELYMNWINEFGALVVGRVPFQFGLGMTYNKGGKPFDHHLSTKDMVAYRIALGNFYIMPAYGKVKEGVLTNEDDINDYMVTLEYKNPESDLEMGVVYDVRVGPQDASSPANGNDIPATYFDPTATVSTGFNVYNMNIFIKKKSDNFNLGLEIGFMNGDTGVRTGAGQKVEIAGFGAAAEVGYKTGNITLDLRAGLASGDDPDTPRFEGYFFSPNYDVAMMMFNYNLGQLDVLRSTLAGTRAAQNSTSSAVNAVSGLDNEVISNAIYFAPRINLSLGERYDIFGNFCYGILQKPPVPTVQGAVGTALGFEADLGFKYHINDKFTWETQLGFFFPGNAFAGTPSNGFKTDLAYGATSKAAINF